MHHICEKRYSQNGVYGNDYKDTRNCQEKVKKISHLKPFNIPHHCDPHLNQTKLNGLLPLTIPGVLDNSFVKWT